MTPDTALALVLLLAPGAPGEVAVHLTPVADAPPSPDGFLPVDLHLADPNGELPTVVQAVRIRPKAGGPAGLYPLAAAPGTRATLRVRVLALSVQETYVVGLLPAVRADAPPLLRREVPVTFQDVAAVETAREKLIDRGSYLESLEDLPHWPTWLPRTVLLAGAGFAVALGGALFLRSPAARIAVVLALSGCGAVAVARLASGPKAVLARRTGPLTVVTARRTGTWSCPAAGVCPVYWRREQVLADDLVYRPGGLLTVTIRPTDVRIFRHQSAATRPAAARP